MASAARVPLVFRAGFAAAVLFWAGSGAAAIPAGYTGTPYKGTPQAIPGRVNLADMDLGGIDVAWYADHNRMNSAGYEPISGNDYRPDDKNLPNICKTNRAAEKPGEGSEDFWEDGKRYPSEESPYEYYMGYAHTVDWVRVTVDVKAAGKYYVSSNWACANNPCGLSLWFNDGSTTPENPDRPLDGVNKSGPVMFEATNDYHKWRAYPKFATVDLSAGVQVLTFNLEVADHLQYGFLQFDPVDGVSGLGGSGAGGGSGSGGTGATSGDGNAGTTGTAGSASGGAPPSSGTPIGGAPGATPPAGTAGASTTPSGLSGGGDSRDAGGCGVARGHAGAAGWALVLAALAILERRRR